MFTVTDFAAFCAKDSMKQLFVICEFKLRIRFRQLLGKGPLSSLQIIMHITILSLCSNLLFYLVGRLLQAKYQALYQVFSIYKLLLFLYVRYTIKTGHRRQVCTAVRLQCKAPSITYWPVVKIVNLNKGSAKLYSLPCVLRVWC